MKKINLSILILISIILIILLILYESSIFSNVIVVGCARNIDKYLKNTKKKLEMIKNLFISCKIIIYENDSTDNTLNILKEWDEEKFIQLITEKNVKGMRTERLAHGRNILYNEAMKYSFDLLIVIDLDNVINNLYAFSIRSCFKLKENWAMVGGNQIFKYYDMWALRTYDDWMPFDSNYCKDIEKKDSNYCLHSRYKSISYFSKPIHVKSCFGGIAIYKREYLDNCSYGNGLQILDNKNEVCEHVHFNKCITDNGGKIYINPKLINCW